MKNTKIRSIIGLALLYLAVFINWQWIWGILFLFWVIPDFFTGITYFIEPVERKKNPILYWAITLSWVWMSLYIIVSATFPQVLGQNYIAKHNTKPIGIYQEANNSPQKTKKRGVFKVADSSAKSVKVYQETAKAPQSATSPSSVPKRESSAPNSAKAEANTPAPTLDYKVLDKKEKQYFVGISAQFNAQDAQLDSQTQELWDYFYKNDISQVVQNIIDERVFFVYSPADKEGTYTATIGFCTKNLDNIYEGLTGITIPPTQYAVFEHQGSDYENFLSTTWANIYESDLPANDAGYNVETYTLNDAYEVTKTEIRVSIQ